MTEIINETVIEEVPVVPVVDNKVEPIVNVPVTVGATKYQTNEYLIYLIFGFLETLLAFRLVFKITGASTASSFVAFIYGLTGIFIMPFEGIFRRGFSEGIETTSILEPATLVAFLVYSMLALGIVKLIRIFSHEQQA